MTDERDRSGEPELPELASLPRQLDPPTELERRVLAAFRSETTRSRNTFSWRQLAAAAALIVISLAAGIAIGRQSIPSVADPNGGPRFMFLLWGSGDAAGSPDDRSAEEYGRWAAAQRETGRSVSGERLSSEAVLVEAGRTIRTVAEVEGFFVVSAASLDEAAEIARNSPHVQRGGRIIVRPIDTP